MLEYKYDTQLLIEGNDLDEDAVRDWFTENFKGDCLLAVGDEELIKIHFHTNESWKVLEYCSTLGEIFDIVIEDMDLKDVAALKEKFQDVFDFCAYMTAFRKRHPSITGDAGASSLGFPEISFHGEVPWKLDFSRPEIRTAAVMFAGYDNKMAKEDCVYLLMNPYWEGVWVELPQLPGGYSWHVAANTGDKKQEIYQNPVRISEERILVGPRSVIVLEADQQ